MRMMVGIGDLQLNMDSNHDGDLVYFTFKTTRSPDLPVHEMSGHFYLCTLDYNFTVMQKYMALAQQIIYNHPLQNTKTKLRVRKQ
jgi:hypothetical protein